MIHPRIIIEMIPHGKMRYDTWGDWFFDPDGTLRIQVSDVVPEARRFLIGLHELVEVELCQRRGITQEVVDAFDFAHQDACNAAGIEPGDMDGAPYRREHRFAMLIEHLMANELGLVGYGKVE